MQTQSRETAIHQIVTTVTGLSVSAPELMAVPEKVAFKFGFGPLFITMADFDTWRDQLGDVLYSARGLWFPKDMPWRVFLFDGKNMSLVRIEGALVIMLYDEHHPLGPILD